MLETNFDNNENEDNEKQSIEKQSKLRKALKLIKHKRKTEKNKWYGNPFLDTFYVDCHFLNSTGVK